MSETLRFRLGERGVDLRSDALGVEHDLERLAPGLVAQPGDPRRLGALRAGAAQRRQPVELARVAGERAFGFLQRAQPGALEIGQRAFGARLGLRDARAADGEIGERPGDERAEAEAEASRPSRGPPSEVAELPSEPPSVIERIEAGGGDADPRGRGGELALGAGGCPGGG